MELSTRLATAQLTLGGAEGSAPSEGQRNQRGGKRNDQGRHRQERTEEARA